MIYDNKRFAILYVDDELKALKLFAKAFGEDFRILTAASAREGLQQFQQHAGEIGVLLTDKSMPGGEDGVWLLEKARRLRPDVVRILITAYADHKDTVAAVNSGAIHKYVDKPVEPNQLKQTLARALEFFMIKRERDQLLSERMARLQHMSSADRIIAFSVLTSGLSHHIRNPLVPVKAFLDLAPARMQDEKGHTEGLRHPDFWREFHKSAQAQVERIENLLKDLETVGAKPERKFNDVVCLRQIVDQAIDSLKSNLEAKKLQVENLVPESLPALTVDRPRFCRLFELLLREEIASLPASSRITWSARLSPSSEGGGEVIQMQMSDDGPPLSEDVLGMVFNPFALRSDSPFEYGIYLMNCYFIVLYHGGRIEARGKAGEGTTFTLHLPTDPTRILTPEGEQDLLEKVCLSQSRWDELISAS